MATHVKEIHGGVENSNNVGKKLHVCQEAGCGKTFKYASKLKKHEESHGKDASFYSSLVKLESSEAVCLEPGCLQYVSNEECLKEHLRSCHQYVTFEVCGSSKQLRKNFRRHIRAHDEECSSERIKCQFDGCDHTFLQATLLSLKSNSEQDLARGGRKRECPTIEILLRKRVRLPKEEFHYDSWLRSVNMD
ncbi:hypothetical protein QQ045_014102 [Rhodiola kirilowii]